MYDVISNSIRLSKLSWRGKKIITYERKQLQECGLHLWKERGKAVTVGEASSVSSAGKH